MCIDLTYPLFAGLRGDEHDYFDSITFGNDTVVILIISERQVGDDNAVYSAFHAFAAEVFKSELHNRV